MLAAIYGELKFFSHSVKNAQGLCHDFGTDAVARENGNGMHDGAMSFVQKVGRV